MNRLVLTIVAIAVLTSNSLIIPTTASDDAGEIRLFRTPEWLRDDAARISKAVDSIIDGVKADGTSIENSADVIRMLGQSKSRIRTISRRIDEILDMLTQLDHKDIPDIFIAPRHIELDALRLDLSNEISVVNSFVASVRRNQKGGAPTDRPNGYRRPPATQHEYSGGSSTNDVVEAEDDDGESV